MKLLVPYIGELQGVDARLAGLAEFLGIEVQSVALASGEGRPEECLERAIPDRDACFVVNPRVMQEWLGAETMRAELAAYLKERFRYLLVYAPRLAEFDASVVAAFSGGSLGGVQPIGNASAEYEIPRDSTDVCEAFAGLRFGPADPARDQVFQTGTGATAARPLISIAGHPFMAAMRGESAEIWFLAGAEVADLKAEVGDAPLTEYFSSLLPAAMALRAIFGEESWRPGERHAAVVIDDPLLRRNYGFLNFESLLGLMRQHNFHTTIAFIPHNFRRSSSRITRLFRENPDRLAICFHGNDHIGAEFASTDIAQLNSMLQEAERRMKEHQETTGLACDRVMVFPQGNFSVEAMSALRAHNFDAAVNTVSHPRGEVVRLTLGELAQPAVLGYGGFPLFLRKDSARVQAPDVAFNLFFGKPVLIVEHHDIGRHAEVLAEAAWRINSIAPDIRWSNLGSAVRNSVLRRRAADGVLQIRAYANSVRVANDSRSAKRYEIEWRHGGEILSAEQVLQDGKPCPVQLTEAGRIRVSIEVPAGDSQTLSVMRQNPHRTLARLGFRHKAGAFVRRRLSEVRDNYLSKAPRVLAAARSLQRSFLQ